MSSVPLWRRYARFFGPDPRADVEDELRFHLESKIDELTAQGWTRQAARDEAIRQFGNLAELQNMGVKLGEARERRVRRSAIISEFLQDMAYAVRVLRREKSFTIVTVLILALGIAANTAVFSFVNTLWLRPLPFPNSHQLTWLSAGRGASAEFRKAAGLSSVTYTVGVFEELQRRNRSFQSLTSYNPFFGNSEYTLTGNGEPQSVAGVMVAENFFRTIGVTPVLGRDFVREECQKGGRPAVLLTHAFWIRQFGGDPSIVGRSITLSKQAATVVGVLPPTFDFGAVFAPGIRFDVFVPAVMDQLRNWGNTLALVGRMKPGVSVGTAQAEIDALVPQIMADHKEWRGDYGSTVTDLKDFVSGKLSRALLVLWSAVGLILLIVCVNISNLLLSRAAARSKEFAMRTALGAGRLRIFRQLIAEGLLFSSAGAVLGLVIAFALISWVARQGSIALPLLNSIELDKTALAWTVLITAVTTLLFGSVPAFRLSADNLQNTLKDGGPGMSAGRAHDRLRSCLVISEVALACVLLIGAGLLTRSFVHVLDVDLGFQPERASVIKIDYDDPGEGVKRGVVLQNVLQNVTSIPGVQSAGIADMLPLGRNRSWGLRARGKSYANDAELAALVRIVTPGYLNSMGMRLRGGRDFSWGDSYGQQRVVIINEAAARRHWPGQDPVGQIALTTGNGGWQETRIIGVVSDVRQHTVEGPLDAEMYLPAWQAGPEGAELVIRSTLPAEALTAPVLRTLRRLHPAQPATELRPLQSIVDQSVSPRWFFVLLASCFALLGLLLACLGIFGVISYSVTQRRQEIGIRMAIGATASRVQVHVVAKALQLASAGICIGALASMASARWLDSMLFETQATDPAVFAFIALLLVVVALGAGYFPARRAARIEPIVALRTQ